ncbi:hypothetical protein F511_42905 [Dorcoceras hygrometricum]|uniref:Uncharacterized protein n=1 Tax=Dorcoceras hygrometricum TaxID=472368 RepID=A0A2Z7AF95_9LAMI|nr:hypothetical protein F511_42905 [Dorcoceras hygrometricum]
MVLIWVVSTADCKKLKESRLEVSMLRLSSESCYKPHIPPRRQVTPPPPPPLSFSEQVLAGLAQILKQNAGTVQAARTEMPYEKFRKMNLPVPPIHSWLRDSRVCEEVRQGWNDSVLHSQSADEAKRKRRCDVVLEISRRSEEQTLKRRRRGGDSAESHCSPADAIWIARNQQKRKRSSSRHESAGAKQLTIYEDLSKLDVNC